MYTYALIVDALIAIISWSIKWYAIAYNEWLLSGFLQAVIFIDFIWIVPDQRFLHHHLGQCRCMIHHFHLIVYMPWLFLFFHILISFSSICVLVLVFIWPFLYGNPISFSQFLTIPSQTFTLLSTHFFFVCFLA